MKKQPRHEHDCDACSYLGQHNEYDLYFCDKQPKIPTLIARYGIKGAYLSGMEFAKPGLSAPLYEAKIRAIQKGLIPVPEMKTIKVTNEMYDALVEISKELNTQDHRATAMPYFFQIQEKEEFVVPEGFSDSTVWVGEDGMELRDETDIKEYFLDYAFEDECETREEAEKKFIKLEEHEIEEKLEELNFNEYNVAERNVYTNAFFTEKACKAHIQTNKHNLKQPVDYLSYATRNPEMELVLKFLCELTGGKLHR